MTIVPLLRHPEHRARLAALHGAEWRHLYEDGWDEATALAELAAERAEGLPRTLVALDDDGALAGSVSLVLRDLPSRPDLDPWLASLYVLPAWRGRGLGGRLVRAIEAEGSALGFDRLFAFTESATPFFVGLGFTVLERAEAAGHPIDLLERRLR